MNKKDIRDLLNQLNDDYVNVHKNYERLYWLFYMGDRKLQKPFNQAANDLDSFRADEKRARQVDEALKDSSGELKTRLSWWKTFFSLYQTPNELVPLKNRIITLESAIQTKRNTMKEGYTDPKTKQYVRCSANKMRMMMRTHDDERVRKACFDAIETIAKRFVDEYVELVGLRNEFAHKLGYGDFYDYQLWTVERMKKKEVFDLFQKVYQKTNYAFRDIRKLEKSMPGLRKPWNVGYLMTGDVTKEEDPFFQFDDALMRWGKSFAAMGIHFNNGTLQLDLLDREGKYNNGFCHYQDLVRYKNGKWIPGSADFTCNVVVGQVGSGVQGLHTLLHEGGHAADRLNAHQRDAILNSEYPPASVAWAETQSQFFDALLDSVEWRVRYVKNKMGEPYPFELFERKVRKLHPVAPLDMMPIMFVSEFEKAVYETEHLTRQKTLEIAKRFYRKYFDHSEDSCFALYIPHIYSWGSSAYYHGYGLSRLAVAQWREYFYKKYGYIVDNPRVGKELIRVWKLGSSKTFLEFVQFATGKRLSADPYIRTVTKTVDQTLKTARQRVARLQSVPEYTKRVDVRATIRMVHGKRVICTNQNGFEKMAEEYGTWLKEQEKG